LEIKRFLLNILLDAKLNLGWAGWIFDSFLDFEKEVKVSYRPGPTSDVSYW
jgi:hypothetical protein